MEWMAHRVPALRKLFVMNLQRNLWQPSPRGTIFIRHFCSCPSVRTSSSSFVFFECLHALDFDYLSECLCFALWTHRACKSFKNMIKLYFDMVYKPDQNNIAMMVSKSSSINFSKITEDFNEACSRILCTCSPFPFPYPILLFFPSFDMYLFILRSFHCHQNPYWRQKSWNVLLFYSFFSVFPSVSTTSLLFRKLFLSFIFSLSMRIFMRASSSKIFIS